MMLRKTLALILCLLLAAASAAAFSGEVAVVSREEGSGTRGAFVELTGIATKDAEGRDVDNTYLEADFVNGTSLVITTVAGNPQAVGYASLSAVLHNDTVKAVAVDGVQATPDTILSGSYPIARPFNVVTKGELTDPLAADFLAFIMSREGQAVVTEDGLVSTATEATPPYAAAGLSGALTVGGSTSVAPVMELLAEAYAALNPGVEIDVQSTGSTAGLTGVMDGTYDIGMASRSLKASETEAGAKATAIGNDGIAVIVNPGNPIEDLTLDQVRRLFTGEITSWDGIAE